MTGTQRLQRRDLSAWSTIAIYMIGLLLSGTGLYVALQGNLIVLQSKVDILLKESDKTASWRDVIDKKNSEYEIKSALMKQDIDRISCEVERLKVVGGKRDVDYKP